MDDDMKKLFTPRPMRAYEPDFRLHNPDANITMPLGDMSVWDDEIPVGMVDRSAQAVIDAQNVELIDLRILWQRALVQRDTWTCVAFGAGVLLGWLMRYV